MVCGGDERANAGLQDTPFINGRREGELENGFRVVQFEIPYSNRFNFLQRSQIFLKFAWKSAWFALREDYDMLFATTTPLTVGIPGILAKVFRRKPFVFEVRDLWPELPRAMGVIKNPLILWAMGVLEWASYRMADGCIGLSPGIVRGITRRGVAPERTTMISNGCDLELFNSNVHEPRRPEGVHEDQFCVIFIGAHGVANGLHSVLDAAAVLKERGCNDIRLVFIGDGKLKPSLKDRAIREGLENCLFLPSVPKMEIISLLYGSDVGMMILDNVPAFYYGTSPNKFFDYIAASLPVLINYPGWLADMISKYKCGLVVPPEDPEAFADALELLSENKEMLKKMALNARLLAEREFNRADQGEKFVEFLERNYKR